MDAIVSRGGDMTGKFRPGPAGGAGRLDQAVAVRRWRVGWKSTAGQARNRLARAFPGPVFPGLVMESQGGGGAPADGRIAAACRRLAIGRSMP